MLRIHFTPEDLTRVRVAPGPDLLWEISNSVQTLQRKDGERVFGAWRRWARPRLPESRELLSPLLPPYGYSPDFLTPSAGERPTFRAAVDALLGTEPARLRAELARLARS
ncbi:transcriptional regulator, partial [Streptomyces albidoflavus]